MGLNKTVPGFLAHVNCELISISFRSLSLVVILRRQPGQAQCDTQALFTDHKTHLFGMTLTLLNVLQNSRVGNLSLDAKGLAGEAFKRCLGHAGSA